MEDKHKLEKLANKLDSRLNPVDAEYKKHELRNKIYETPVAWEDDLIGNIETNLENQNNMSRKVKNPFYKFLVGSLYF